MGQIPCIRTFACAEALDLQLGAPGAVGDDRAGKKFLDERVQGGEDFLIAKTEAE
jgi:hypothetical protein